MSPPQSDIPDLHWPKVVHDEALPLPGKHLAAGPDITTAPMSSVTQAPRSLPSGVSSKPQKPEPSQPIRPSDSVKVPASPAMPRSLPAPPMPKRPAQAVIQPPKPAVPDKPYVSTALVTFEDEPATPPVKPAKMAAPVIPIGVAMSPLELQQRVLRVCAGATRDVQVTMQADRRWEGKVKVPTAALKEVSAKIMQLPDMAQPHVRLKLEISE